VRRDIDQENIAGPGIIGNPAVIAVDRINSVSGSRRRRVASGRRKVLAAVFEWRFHIPGHVHLRRHQYSEIVSVNCQVTMLDNAMLKGIASTLRLEKWHG
jgi:hypothetical protein